MTTEPFSGERVFSAEDLEHFETQGYVTLAGAVPAEQVSAAADAIWQFLGMDPTMPDDWYRPPHSPDGLVEIHQHQALWDNRQSPRIYAAFRLVQAGVDLRGTSTAPSGILGVVARVVLLIMWVVFAVEILAGI